MPDRASSKGRTIRQVEILSNKLLTTAFEASLECITETRAKRVRQKGSRVRQKGSGTVNKRLTNCEQIFEKSRMASNENS